MAGIRTDGQTDRKTDGQGDRWTDGQMDRWTDGRDHNTSAKLCFGEGKMHFK